MQDIHRLIRAARWRLSWQTWARAWGWSLGGSLMVAALAILVPKVVHVPFAGDRWSATWIVAAGSLGIFIALIWAWTRALSPLAAAIELDRRSQLKERLSTAIALDPVTAASPIGRALVEETTRRIGRMDVAELCPLQSRWQMLLPLLPTAILVAVILFVPDASPHKASATVARDQQRVKKSTEALRRKWQVQKKKAEAEELEDARKLFEKLEQGLQTVQNNRKSDQRETTIRLNDLSREIERRRAEIGTAGELRQRFQRMQDFKPGPGDRIANAIKQGDFGQAAAELKKMAQELSSDKLSTPQKQALEKQLRDVANRLAETAAEHETRKQELQQEIDRLRNSGDRQQAAKLQDQLDKMMAMQPSVDQLQRLAQQMSQAAQNMQQGATSQSSNQLGEIAESLEAMQGDLDELELLDDTLDQLADAKSALSCNECDGEG